MSFTSSFDSLELSSDAIHLSIPERVVHARGAGAHGTFTLHTSLEDVTCAKVLTKVGQETPTFTRFSTVLGSSGAAETAREGEPASAPNPLIYTDLLRPFCSPWIRDQVLHARGQLGHCWQ